MSDELVDELPEGFLRVSPGLGFSDQLQPFYRRVRGTDVRIGFRVAEKHLNLMGNCHGGVFMTLADIGASSSLHAAREAAAPAPTLNLSFDFMAPAQLGDWLETRADHVEAKRRFGFCAGAIYRDETALVRYSGMFYFAKPGVGPAGGAGVEALRKLTGG